MAKSAKQQRIISKIFTYHQRLLQGEKLQIHGLMPILGLLESDEQSAHYALFVLTETLQNVRKPINPVLPMPVSTKRSFILTMQVLLQQKQVISAALIARLHADFERYNGGSKRLYVHADRSKYADADIGVIGAILCCFDNSYGENIHCFRRSRYLLYRATEYFCCDYKNYRFKPNKQSASRVLAIARYFDVLYPCNELRASVP